MSNNAILIKEENAALILQYFLAYYGLHVDVSEINKVANFRKNLATLENLKLVAEYFGAEIEISLTQLESIRRNKYPLITYLSTYGIVAILKIQAKKVSLYSEEGEFYLSIDDFLELWNRKIFSLKGISNNNTNKISNDKIQDTNSNTIGRLILVQFFLISIKIISQICLIFSIRNLFFETLFLGNSFFNSYSTIPFFVSFIVLLFSYKELNFFSVNLIPYSNNLRNLHVVYSLFGALVLFATLFLLIHKYSLYFILAISVIFFIIWLSKQKYFNLKKNVVFLEKEIILNKSLKNKLGILFSNIGSELHKCIENEKMISVFEITKKHRLFTYSVVLLSINFVLFTSQSMYIYKFGNFLSIFALELLLFIEIYQLFFVKYTRDNHHLINNKVKKNIKNKLLINEQIFFKDIVFSYSILENKILNFESFNLKVKQMIAIVGSSGVGKSTVAKLISGELKPILGEICLDSTFIEDISQNLLVYRVDPRKKSIYSGFNHLLFNNADINRDDLMEIFSVFGLQGISDELLDLDFETIQSKKGVFIYLSCLIIESYLLKPQIIILDNFSEMFLKRLLPKINQVSKSLSMISIITMNNVINLDFVDHYIMIKDSKLIQGTYKELVKE